MIMIITMKTKCEICGKESAIKHHLKYENDLTMLVCPLCHRRIHSLSRWTDEQRKRVMNLIDRYGIDWIYTKEKFQKALSIRGKKRTAQKQSQSFHFKCLKCSHEWIGRMGIPPKECPNCKARNWSKEKKIEALQD